MRQPKKKNIRTAIQDIEIDENGRRVLNTPDKIVRWIQYQFEEQTTKHSRTPEIPVYHYIDLSNCVVSTHEHDNKPSLMNLCEIAGKIDCVINTYDEYPNHTKFHQEVLEELRCDNSIFYASFFHCTKFHKRVMFSKTIFYGGSWGNCEFLDHLFIEECELRFGNFENNIFHGCVRFYKSYFNHFQVIFRKCLFKDEVNFNNITIREIATFEKSSHSYIDFSHSVFEADFDMSNVNLSTNCWFEECYFKQSIKLNNINSAYTISFGGSTINNELIISTTERNNQNLLNRVSISHCNIQNRLDFENNNIQILLAHFANIQDNGVLRMYKNSILHCDMNSICNRGFIFFEANSIGKITLENAVNIGFIELENTDTNTKNIANRKTARILKDSAYKSNNVIDALKYRMIELDIHRKEKGTIWYDKIILWLNKWSNNHNRNFIWGIGFTIGVATLFFWLINYLGTTERIFELNWRFDFTGFGNVWKKYLDVLNVLNFRDKLNGIELNAIGETLFLVAKIFVAYCMYQTVSAFRKYSKNH